MCEFVCVCVCVCARCVHACVRLLHTHTHNKYILVLHVFVMHLRTGCVEKLFQQAAQTELNAHIHLVFNFKDQLYANTRVRIHTYKR